jgi:hypothetical protein
MRQILTVLLLAALSCSTKADAQQTTSMGFLFFTGKAAYPHAELSWETIQELTVSHFNLQRSVDGAVFTTISRTTAKGDTSSQRSNKYRFTDATISTLSDTGYYRLECVGRDGVAYYSKVVTVLFPASKKLVVMGSAKVQQTLWLTITATKQDRLSLLITDGNGRIAKQQIIDCAKGTERKSMDVSALPAGIYIVSVWGGGMDMTARFVKH